MSNPLHTEKAIIDLLNRAQYKYKDMSKSDLLQVFSFFKELTPKIDSHVSSSGQMKDLITLTGTIPVKFKDNKSYNIPIQIYLMETHPFNPPICYVRPTPDMSVNVSNYVDGSGLISLPAICEWNYPNTDLYMLLNFLVFKFGEQTPVYAKPPGGAQRPPTATPYPVYPHANGGPPTYPTPPGATSSYPSYPGGGAGMPPYPVSSNPYYPSSMQMPQPNPAVKSSGSINSLQSSSSSNQPPYPTGANSSQQRATPTPSGASASSYSDETIKPEYYRMSLVSAVQDKVRKRVNEHREQRRAEIEALQRVTHDLEVGKQKLQLLMRDTEDETQQVIRMTQEVKRRSAQLTENLNKLQHREKANIEDAVVTTAPLYRQLLQCYAEELAIQDFVFYLGEGLTNRTITLDVFLKQVRALSRKQFMLRATMQKAREKAGLPN